MSTDKPTGADTYNATIERIESVADGLSIFFIRPDAPIPGRQPGHYVSIALVGPDGNKLIRRPYSLSRSLGPAIDPDLLELLIIRVPEGDLTPILFEQGEGGRLFVRPKMLGTYLLPDLDPEMTMILASTGTGVAPHMTMLEACVNTCKQVLMMECVRYGAELAYAEQIREFRKTHPNLVYISLVTREGGPKRYIQDYFRDGILEKEYGVTIRPENTHVFACGNPAMIGIPKKARKTGHLSYETPGGLVEILTARYGLSIHKARQPGQIHFEKYW
ncbi:MAG: hypothetical protein QGH58_03840 [Arenicellales bacterium]|jgi:ferredoxin--NADP+ reductase|nr:hypothetical protein [Arenicellales bacterium]MDP6552905.1 hypothetical protein [Arenicellales bacterium]MDP6791021.1 hypothetical protein [Arenicellales bacterium]MDP6919029.1 hypothetical protein [Arenicellales bacterium]|tara:strand:- start:1502 stop:2326 length:825 start_codon:yes stop_codon:yes gene_type:complete